MHEVPREINRKSAFCPMLREVQLKGIPRSRQAPEDMAPAGSGPRISIYACMICLDFSGQHGEEGLCR